jgi:hypothetical protein
MASTHEKPVRVRPSAPQSSGYNLHMKRKTLTDDFGNRYYIKNKLLMLTLEQVPMSGHKTRNLGQVLNGTWYVIRFARDIYKPNNSFSLSRFALENADSFGIQVLDFQGQCLDNSIVDGLITPEEWLDLSEDRHMYHMGYEPQADVRIHSLKEFLSK